MKVIERKRREESKPEEKRREEQIRKYGKANVKFWMIKNDHMRGDSEYQSGR